MGVKAGTNARVHLPAMTTLYFDDAGKIAKAADFFDPSPLM